MAQKELTGTIEFCDGFTVTVRHVSSPRSQEIYRQHRPRNPLGNMSDAEEARYSDALANEYIVDWQGLTPLTAYELGYMDYEALPVDAEGFVPYSPLTAQKLFKSASFADFRQPLLDGSAELAKQDAREKKRSAKLSAT